MQETSTCFVKPLRSELVSVESLRGPLFQVFVSIRVFLTQKGGLGRFIWITYVSRIHIRSGIRVIIVLCPTVPEAR